MECKELRGPYRKVLAEAQRLFRVDPKKYKLLPKRQPLFIEEDIGYCLDKNECTIYTVTIRCLPFSECVIEKGIPVRSAQEVVKKYSAYYYNLIDTISKQITGSLKNIVTNLSARELEEILKSVDKEARKLYYKLISSNLKPIDKDDLPFVECNDFMRRYAKLLEFVALASRA